MKNKALLHKTCVIPKGASFGDARYRYKAYWCMTPAEQAAVRRRYPHNAPGIPDDAYAYPITKNGSLAKGRARRTLLWSYKHTVRRVGKHRARQLFGLK